MQNNNSNNNIGTTSITDLPITNSVGIINQPIQSSINVNPDSIPTNLRNDAIQSSMENNTVKNTVVMDNAVSQTSYNELVGQIQQADKLGITQLPSRDVPSNTDNIVMDDQTKPNYIPEQEIMEDYIKNYQTPDDVIEENNNDTKNKDRLEELYSRLQMPLLVAILYFLFNLPVIRKYLNKYIPNLFNKDGNPNLVGYIFNSLLFGLLYYILNNFITSLLN